VHLDEDRIAMIRFYDLRHTAVTLAPFSHAGVIRSAERYSLEGRG